MSFLSSLPEIDFLAPKAAYCLDLETLNATYELTKVSAAAGSIFFEIKEKSADSAGASPINLEGCVKVAANIRVVKEADLASLNADETAICHLKPFQLFSRTIKGAETLHSKKHRIMEKAAILAKGFNGYFTESILIKTEYWQEVLLKNHPYGADVFDYFKAWDMNKKNHMTFEDFIDMKPENLQPESRVVYLNEEERKIFEVELREGKIFNALGPIDTSKIPTDKHEGYAIYVISCDLKMYVGPYHIGKFHHSSFLSGAPVLGAGEIQTTPDGTIVLISSKSGHYKPSAMQLHNTFTFLEIHGVDLKAVGLIENSGGSSITRHDSISAFVETSPAPSPTKCLNIRADAASPGGFRLAPGSSSPVVVVKSPGFRLAASSPYAAAMGGGSEGALEERASPAKFGPESLIASSVPLRIQAKAPFAEIDSSCGMSLKS